MEVSEDIRNYLAAMEQHQVLAFPDQIFDYPLEEMSNPPAPTVSSVRNPAIEEGTFPPPPRPCRVTLTRVRITFRRRQMSNPSSATVSSMRDPVMEEGPSPAPPPPCHAVLTDPHVDFRRRRVSNTRRLRRLRHFRRFRRRCCVALPEPHLDTFLDFRRRPMSNPPRPTVSSMRDPVMEEGPSPPPRHVAVPKPHMDSLLDSRRSQLGGDDGCSSIRESPTTSAPDTQPAVQPSGGQSQGQIHDIPVIKLPENVCLYPIATLNVPPAPPVNMPACESKKRPREDQQDEPRPYVKKPPNAFMLFRKEQRPNVVAENHPKDSAAMNTILGQKGKTLSQEQQHLHEQQHPDWSTRDIHGKKRKRVRQRGTAPTSTDSCVPQPENPQKRQRVEQHEAQQPVPLAGVLQAPPPRTSVTNLPPAGQVIAGPSCQQVGPVSWLDLMSLSFTGGPSQRNSAPHH